LKIAQAVLDSVVTTGRLLVVDEAPPRCGLVTDIAALAANRAFASLKAPVELVTAPHSPIPFALELERDYLPSAEKIEAAARTIPGWR
jgi:pyruvate dehydrogenase E1 component beta subunit